MKIRDLILRLTEIADDLEASLGADIEPVVVAAYQPAHPLTGSIDAVTTLDEDDQVIVGGAPVVWIAIGGHPAGLPPLAPGIVFEVEP